MQNWHSVYNNLLQVNTISLFRFLSVPGRIWMKIVADNPFLKEKDINPDWLHVTFLSDSPRQSDREAISTYDFSPDRFYLVAKRGIFVLSPGLWKYQNIKFIF